ncbi:MAG: AAA family ATPase [Bacteroidales bacterium]|nr:AAA family ATPase [Bacteroidales bacterium]
MEINAEEVRRSLELFQGVAFDKVEDVGIRIKTKEPGKDGKPGRVYSGFFATGEDAVNALERFTSPFGVEAAWVQMNPLKEGYLRDASYHDFASGGHTVRSEDIKRIRYILVDVDRLVKNHDSATDFEKDTLYKVAVKLWTGKPMPYIFADSGNGYHVIYKADIAPEDSEKVNRLLRALRSHFHQVADIDTNVSDPSRCCKLYGTKAAKGEDTPTRPHRYSCILQVENDAPALTIDDIRQMTAYFGGGEEDTPPAPQKPARRPENANRAEVLASAESVISQLEKKVGKGEIILPDDRVAWLAITAGMARTLGDAGEELYIRFAALWPKCGPDADIAKYREMARPGYFDRNGLPEATIAKLFQFCEKYGILPNVGPSWRDMLFYPGERPQPENLISVNGESFAPRGEICLVTGKQKVGKSAFIAAMIAAAISGAAVLNIEPIAPLRVLLVDTEQGDAPLAQHVERISRLSGKEISRNDDTFQVMSLRRSNAEECVRLIEQSLRECPRDLVVIDGARDLVEDTNDLAASREIVRRLMKWGSEYDAAVVVVAHMRPDGMKVDGHIGSELQRKVYASILLEDTDGSIKVSPADYRGAPFDEYYFTRDRATGDPVLWGSEPAPVPKTAKEILLSLMTEGQTYTHKHLVQLCVNRSIKAGTAKKAISELYSHHDIVKVNDGYKINISRGAPL